MSAQRKTLFSPEQYLERERKAEFKSEYYAGEMYAMAGATEAHVLIVSNLTFEFVSQFRRRPCKTYATDMKVRIDASGLYAYPDVVLICGDPEFTDGRQDTLLNPQVIIEVLSPSTAAYDRGEKFLHYRLLPSLTDYLLVSQNAMRVEHYARQADGTWLLTDASGPEGEVVLASVGCRLRLADIYDKVDAAPTGFLPVIHNFE